MAMVGNANIAKLRKQFKAANKRVDKAKARYQKLVSVLYMPWGKDGNIDRVSWHCFRSDGLIVAYATDLSWTFYRVRHGGKFYEKPQPIREGFSERVWDNYTQTYQLVGQDYLDLLKLEYAIDAAIDERARLLDELEKLGVDVYNDAELWQ